MISLYNCSSRYLNSLFVVCALAFAVAGGLASCGDKEIAYPNLYLSITSEAPGERPPVDRLVIQFRAISENGAPALFQGVDFLEHRYEKELPPTVLLDKAPYVVSVMPGKKVSGKAFLVVLGLVKDKTVATWSTQVDLSQKSEVGVFLSYFNEDCDKDGDGLPACKDAPGCCKSSTAASHDCDDNNVSVNPLAPLPDCIPCSMSGQDLNCDTVIDNCTDVDGDNHADCDPSADCNITDGKIHADAEELCGDGIDNNCNNETDEGFITCKNYTTCEDEVWCEEGPCPETPLEDCGDNVDNNCDGKTDDEDLACQQKWDEDYDGDGVLNDKDCNPYHAEIYPGSAYPGCCLPENYDGVSAAELKFFCDFDCDGTASMCTSDDADGDTWTGAADCNDQDPTIYKNAPEHCSDGVDQNCVGGDDCVGDDNDADGFTGAPEGPDCDDSNPEVHPWATEVCNGIDDNCNGFIDEGNPIVSKDGPVTNKKILCPNPEKPFGVCAENDDLMGVKVCGHNLQTAPVRISGQEDVGTADIAIVCVDFHMPNDVESSCDGKDEDCDGSIDEDLWVCNVQPGSDPTECAEEDKAYLGDPCGKGVCASGEVVCAANAPDVPAEYVQNGAVCSSWVKVIPENSPEACDNKDNDCDGVVDSYSLPVAQTTCFMAGVCALSVGKIKTLCVEGKWQCDYSDVVNYEADGPNGSELSCDGLDNNCKDGADENFTWKGKGLNTTCDGIGECSIGVVACSNNKKEATCSTNANGPASGAVAEICDGKDNDCDGKTDEDTSWEGIAFGESCDGTGNCGLGKVVCANDGTKKATCSTNANGTNSQAKTEVCDTQDNDCDGEVDEDLNAFTEGVTCIFQGVCTKNNVSAECKNGVWDCDYDQIKDYEKPEVTCDGKDNDCDGSVDELDTLSGKPTCNQKGVCGGTQPTCSGDKGWTCNYDVNPQYTTNESKGNWCDDKDNDCDNLIDEKYPTKGTTCTKGQGMCANKGVIICLTKSSVGCSVTGKPNITECDDNNPCTTNDKCSGSDNSKCQGTLYECQDDGLECTVEECNGDGSCSHTLKPGYCIINNSCKTSGTKNPLNPECQSCDPQKSDSDWSNVADLKSCDDGNDCSHNDQCIAGVCKGVGFTCDEGLSCQVGKCKAGGNQCDYSQLKPGTCLIGGKCYGDGDTNPNNPCQFCTSTNKFAWTFKPNKTVCDDGNKCTLSSSCNSGGQCVGSNYNTCDDGNECTADSCSNDALSIDGCQHANQTGNACNSDGVSCTSDLCNNGSCSHVIKKNYCLIDGACILKNAKSSENECEFCAPSKTKTEWSDVSAGASCNDGNDCTKNDQCNGGGSCAGDAMTPLDCNDSNPCTNDYCFGKTGCVNEPQNGTACTSDGLPCTVDQCAIVGDKGVCVHDLLFGACLIGKQCYSGGEDNPGNQCEECKASTPQQWSAKDNGTSCNADSDGCTQGDSCQTGKCEAAAPTTICSALGDDCNLGTCVSTGNNSFDCQKKAKAAGTLCDDTKNDTKDDKCDTKGNCAGTQYTCTPNQCQETSVPNGTSCTVKNKTNGTECDDVNACTHTDQCTAGQCGGTKYTCLSCETCDGTGQCTVNPSKCSIGGKCYNNGDIDSLNPCRECDASKPKVWTNDNTNSCSDGDKCTQTDSCSSGTCVGSNPVQCSALDQCHIAGTCVKTTGQCTNPNKMDGSLCNDSNACTSADKCTAGTCAGSTYSCLGCETCDGDGNCDVNSGKCSIAGKCYNNGALDSANSCQECNSAVSQSGWTTDDSNSCSDGKLCTEGDQCTAGVCSGSKYSCLDLCEVCDGAGGCTVKPTACKIDGQCGCLVDGQCYKPGAADPNNVCAACDPVSNSIKFTPVAAGTACDDGDACTSGTTCNASGTCVSPTSQKISWDDHIQPLVSSRCSSCHMGVSTSGGVSFNTYANTQETRDDCPGPGAVTVGALMANKVTATPDCGQQMPTIGSKLTLQQQLLLQAWVTGGMLETCD